MMMMRNDLLDERRLLDINIIAYSEIQLVRRGAV